jgi:hypothetical protein
MPSATQWTAGSDLSSGRFFYNPMYDGAVKLVALNKVDFGSGKETIHALDDGAFFRFDDVTHWRSTAGASRLFAAGTTRSLINAETTYPAAPARRSRSDSATRDLQRATVRRAIADPRLRAWAQTPDAQRP